jgi:DNA primase
MSYEIISILDSILGSNHPFSGGEYYYHCPFCHHYNQKLAVNISKRKWQCWKCGMRGGSLLSLVKKLDIPKSKYDDLRKLLYDEIPRYKKDTCGQSVKISLPGEYMPLYEPVKSIIGKHALWYLKDRGVGNSDVLRYQIGYCEEGKYQNRVIIPSYDEFGSLNYFVSRDFYDTSSLKYLIPPLTRNIVGFDFYINWKYPITLVEGVFDAMTVKRNAIPLFGKQISHKLKEKIIKQGVNEIYLALDQDALKDTISIAEYFMNNGIIVYIVELSGKDPSELGFETTRDLIENAEALTFRKLVNLKLALC